MLKKGSTILTVILLLLSFAIPASATTQDYPVSPYYLNATNCSYAFSISSSGVAFIEINCYGTADSFVKLIANVKIQKRFLGLFWSDVAIGEPNDTWTAQSTSLNANLSKTFQLSKTGTYRAVFDIEVVGINGNDQIEDKIQATYN